MSEDTPLKPSPDQLAQALSLAQTLREQGRDPDFLGHALLYCEHRIEILERVRRAAERYLHSGLAEHEHSDLVRALDVARSSELATTHEEPGRFGLD
jgi:hypothetical protein